MTYTNNNKKQIDLPVREWNEFAPIITAAASSATISDVVANQRYFYYINAVTALRYDTWKATRQQLAAPYTSLSTATSVRYSDYWGYRWRVISNVSSTQFYSSWLNSWMMDWMVIRIYAWAWAGQKRTITTVWAPIIEDWWTVTAATANLITDTTKKRKVNQWRWYQIRINFWLWHTQTRKILYNDATSITVAGTDMFQIERHSSYAPFAAAPNWTPAATAWNQTMYSIEKSLYTIDTAWTTNPDHTSRFTVESGEIRAIHYLSAAPFYVLQKYSIIEDIWYRKTECGWQIPAAITEVSAERISNVWWIKISWTASAWWTRTITDSTKTLVVDRRRNSQIRLTWWTWTGQFRRIQSNWTNYFEVARKWDIAPDATTTYEIRDNLFAMWFVTWWQAAMLQYDIESDLTYTWELYDSWMCRAWSVKLAWTDAISISTWTRATNGILAVASTPTVWWTNYTKWDILTCTATGSWGTVIVTSIWVWWAVTWIELVSCWNSYWIGTWKSTSWWTGSWCTINITSVWTNALVTTWTAHLLKNWDSVVISWASDAAWNWTYTVLWCASSTTFNVAITAAGNIAYANAQSTTVIVDADQNRDINEHRWRIINLYTSSTPNTAQSRVILSNTANTITVATIVAWVNASSRYTIQDAYWFGTDDQWLVTWRQWRWAATWWSTTTLIDTTKTREPNQWVNRKFIVEAGTWLWAIEITITANTIDTLTFAAQTFTIDTTTRYRIKDALGVATAWTTTTLTDSSQNRVVNQRAGKRVRFLTGTWVNQELAITSNTATALTFATATAPDTTTAYCIYSIPAKSTWITLMFLYDSAITDNKGKYLFCPRWWASNTWDSYNIAKGKRNYWLYFTPQFETLTTGSMYAYDGKDKFYFTKDATGRIYVYNLLTNKTEPFATVPHPMSTAYLWNRMEIVTTNELDSLWNPLQFLYIMRHNAADFRRILIHNW